MEIRKCLQYLALIRYNLKDFVGSLIRAKQKNFISFQKLKIQIKKLNFNYLWKHINWKNPCQKKEMLYMNHSRILPNYMYPQDKFGKAERICKNKLFLLETFLKSIPWELLLKMEYTELSKIKYCKAPVSITGQNWTIMGFRSMRVPKYQIGEEDYNYRLIEKQGYGLVRVGNRKYLFYFYHQLWVRIWEKFKRIFATPKFSCLSKLIRRKKELVQKKMPFWSFINNLLVYAEIRYFLNPYVKNYKRNFFTKDVNSERLVDETSTRGCILIYLRTIHFCYREMYKQLRIIWLDWNLEWVHLTICIICKINVFGLKRISYKINLDWPWFGKKMRLEELYAEQLGINRCRLLKIWKRQLHKQPLMILFSDYTHYLKFWIELIHRHKLFMGENRVIWALEDCQDELLVFGYAISTLVTMDAFAQLTRLKESMLDLLDPLQFMRELVIGGLLKAHFMKSLRNQKEYGCFIYHQVEMNTIWYRQEILWRCIKVSRKNRLFRLDTVKNSRLLRGNRFIFEVFFLSNIFLLEPPSFLLSSIMMRIGLKSVLICNAKQFRSLGPRSALLGLGWNAKWLSIQGFPLSPNTRERSFIPILTRSFYRAMGILKVFHLLCINVPIKNTCMHQKTRVGRGKYIKKGQVLADGAATVGGELALGKNVLVAYMPWEGYNFEDAVLISERLLYGDIYTSFHIRKYEIQTHVTSQGPERITNEIPHLEARLLRNLDKNGIVMLGSWVETGDILVGKLTPQTAKESSYAPEDRLLRAILGIQVSTSKETCLKLPIGGRGRVIDVRWIQKKGGSSYNPETIRVYISQKREIKVGDKVAGRHGNKGIISKILPRQDMPFLQDGRPVDMVFNPLGVPSRMNVGQIFECSLGLAGGLLNRHYRIAPFDERYEQEASRKLVFSELYEASKQTANPWVFEPEYPGKSRIFDGRTGDPFEQPVIIGKPYILKLIHQVDDKIHGRSSGHYALVTQQPLRGRSKQGGQRVGEMEVWALEGFGVAHILQEMLTYKSDHIRARQEVLGTTIIGGTIPKPEDAPESFRLLVRELRSLALELNHFLVSEKNFQINKKEA
uniref:DNA-directed RNA polymerase n=1 Tax=Commiphora gileadensis TaxID=1700993 RepID=A0A410PA52_9ROSI|nr:RNA polymerase betasubunit [Commiphora gileadensis]QAT19689.1 RNA polymerase betasubunit [Commiphora gileadensis]